MEECFGVIPLRKSEGRWQALLVLHGKGHWGFPKGHPDEGEDPRDTASRELEEETGLRVVRWCPLEPYQESYTNPEKGLPKRVTYYAALVEGALHPLPGEIHQCLWVDWADLTGRFTFPEGRRVAEAFLGNCPPEQADSWL